MSVYVDGFKLVGNKKIMAGMWNEIRKKMDLEPPVPFNNSVYLGCTQRDAPTPLQDRKDKKDFFEKHGRPWAYSNPKLIDEYIGFKRQRESFQRDYADQKEGGHIEMQETR